MGTLANILSTHREKLKKQGRRRRLILYVYIALTGASLALAAYVVRTGDIPVPLPGTTLMQNFIEDNKYEYAISIVYFFGGAAFASALQIWRKRRARIKTLIAEAFLKEHDPDTALRLILELQLDDTAWMDEQRQLLVAGDFVQET